MGAETVFIPDGFFRTISPVLGHEVHALETNSEECRKKIVLIHGALASRRYLLPTAVLLSKSMTVLVPEMPGHGASSKPAHALSVQEQAAVLFEWFQLKRLHKAHIFANSYGCQVAAELVANHPEIAISLTLSDPTVDPAARTIVQEAYRLYIDGFSEPKGAQGQLFADLSDLGLVRTFETVFHMLQDDIRPKLAKIKCPALVVRGEKDPIAPQKWTEEVASYLSGARFHVIPNSPHSVNFATPVQLTDTLLKFINDVDAKVSS